MCDRTRIGPGGPGTLRLNGDGPVAGEPIAVIVKAHTERLVDEQTIKSAAINKEIARDRIAISKYDGCNVPVVLL